jgi:hypothetical protein
VVGVEEVDVRSRGLSRLWKQKEGPEAPERGSSAPWERETSLMLCSGYSKGERDVRLVGCWGWRYKAPRPVCRGRT